MTTPMIPMPHEKSLPRLSLNTRMVEFLQWNHPALYSGDYILRVDQNVTVTPPKQQPADPVPIKEWYRNEHRIAVLGSRFTLPGASVVSMFPPNLSSGNYEQVLPHVVFAEQTLLWQRQARENDNLTPWLALLVFDADVPCPVLQTARLADLQHANTPPVSPPSTLPATTVSYGDTKGFELEWGSSPLDACKVLDLKKELFLSLAPSLNDLVLLGHARVITDVSRTLTPDEAPGNYAVLCSNRVTVKDGNYEVHLVSLEGMGGLLPNEDGSAPSTPDWANYDTVRLASLASWSFVSKDPAETFTGYLTAPSFTVAPLANVLAHNDGSDAATYMDQAYKAGYTLLPHITRVGETTASWYRGPLMPYVANAPLPVKATLSFNPDSLIRYDPDHGIMDMSYATAWQLGQLTALQDGLFAQAMVDWKRSLAANAITQRWSHEMVRRLVPSTLRSSSALEGLSAQETLSAAVPAALSEVFNVFRSLAP